VSSGLRTAPAVGLVEPRPALVLLPLLVLYVVVCAATQPGPLPVNDEGALLDAAGRVLDGGYAARDTVHDVRWLWHGPGVPVLLAPLVALDLPLELIRLLAGPALLFAAVLLLHRVLCLHVGPRPALLGALALGLYLPALAPLRTVHKEPLAMLLVALAMLGLARGRRRDAALAGLALGALVMVRLEYGWVLVALLALCGAAALAGRRGAVVRASATALAVGLACCLPWLAYTRDVSGRFPYWGNAGGESLFWMSPTGVAGQTGEFHGVRPVFEQPALAPYRPLFRRLERLTPLERDLALQRLARANVRARPAAYARNLAANASRLWFGVPMRPAPPPGTVALHLLFNTALLAALGWVALVRRRLPPVAPAFAACAAAGAGIHLLPSADPRMLLPLVPIAVWLVTVALSRTTSPTSARG
jgi:hypothetical protein